MNVLGLITARGGSKGIPGKNIAPCGGRPLLAWTCAAATGARCITRSIVSTDDPAIAEVARAHGVEVPFMRPAELASDSARSIGVAQHAIEALADAGWQTDVLVLLQPTSPLRTAAHVDAAFGLLGEADDAVVSVMHVPHRFAPWSLLETDGAHVRDYVKGELGFARDRRQGQPTLLARNGPAVVITRASTIANGSFYGERCGAYEMSNEDSTDIDDTFDSRSRRLAVASPEHALMCGIAGIVGSAAERERGSRMSAAIAHRGPDDVGEWTSPGVTLAHRRLAIIDLSPSGHQPMASRDGRYHIVYNGEIFNYREVAAKLPDVAWRSESDTEVLLEAFIAWGPACLDQLVGMYSFAIWDALEHRLFCARDRLGIKPLYLARLGDGWAFGSEIGALLAAGVPARGDEATIYDFLARDFYEHSDATFFAGISKLPAGHWCYLRAGGPVVTTCYWKLADDVARIVLPNTRAQRGERLIDELGASVTLALRSDVPVGITLSGGLDSAVLLSLVDRTETAKLAAFSFDFEDPAYSERPWVEAMATHTGHAAMFRTVTPNDFTSTFEAMVAAHQEPHAGLPITAYQLCFEQFRRAGVIVAMDGSGIDEGLAGYERFKPAHWADLERLGDHDTLARELADVDPERARVQMRAAASDSGESGRGQDLTESTRRDCIAASLRDPGASTFERPFDDALRNLMYRELRYTKLPRALRFRDRLSMAYGTELRPPFLDHRALAYMFALPAEDRISHGRTKALLRDAAATLLPDAVRLASKRSVQTPQREWFRGPLAAWVRERVDQPSFWKRGWVEREPAIAAMEQFLAGKGDNSFFIWQWIALEQWARAFLD